MSNKTIPSLVLICLFLFSCSLTPNIKVSGVANLEKKKEVLVIGVSNKNDVISYLGESILKESPGDDSWAYIESSEIKNIFGKRKIIKNNVLLLEFNQRGVLAGKHILNINDINKLDLDKDITNTNALNDSFSKKFFGSLRKRMQSKLNQ
jgi:outer membrane protein assembly factor BamE (lipoprotein component of BamABCDE complex)